MHDLRHDYTSRKISPWGGIKFFYKTYLQSGIRDCLLQADLPQKGSNRGYESIDLVEGFMTSVVLGSRRLAHSEYIRQDEVIREIFGWERGMGCASTFSRFFSKFSVDRNNEVFPTIMKSWFESMAVKKMTIDIDSTVITRYGKQEEACVGYNPTKPGRVSHHPLMAFCDDLKMVVNAWMRSGDSHSSTNMDEFFTELLEIVPAEKIGLLRGDSGFCGEKVFQLLENQASAVNYIIRMKHTPALINRILEQSTWIVNSQVANQVKYCEFDYQAHGWSKPRRIVAALIPELGKQDQQQRVMFAEDEIRSNHRIMAFVTNSGLPCKEIHTLYNGRADCENRIKELKYDYGIDGFALQQFGAMEAAFRFTMLAYNIMSLFRQKVLLSPSAKRLSTIKFECIAIGSYLGKTNGKKTLKLSAEGKRRHFLEHIFENADNLAPPFQFSNA